jgi:hypothetical protein
VHIPVRLSESIMFFITLFTNQVLILIGSFQHYVRMQQGKGAPALVAVDFKSGGSRDIILPAVIFGIHKQGLLIEI